MVVTTKPEKGAHWYKDAVIYQLHIRSFFDSNGDGIGDFGGLTKRLGYLKDLGVTAVWLLPFYPSPLKDDGYDIADYKGINPIYGSLAEFKRFLRTAHKMGLKVITELVLNHTSDQHPWFQRARKAPSGSRERDFYVWSDTPDRYRDARIIFKDFETSNWAWDPLARAYYWHRFYSNQPDLNYESSDVQREMLKTVDFWLDMGVDGLRLDAVPYLYERDGTNCENLPETHEFLKKLRRHVDEKYENRMLLAEANQWPEDAMAYFGNDDECHMCFHFPLMPRMFMSLEMEDRFPVVDILAQIPDIPEMSQWAIFLRNHDELTLEMVTDEERDYMYRVYAVDSRARINLGIRRRLAPLLGGNRHKIELLNALLLSLPGTPVIYYGDEIGMGDNIYLGDRNGVRTPLQWSSNRNAGFSEADSQRLVLPVVADHEFHYEAVNIENQQRNPNSLLWWMKRIIGLRKESAALTRGSLRVMHPNNRKVLCYMREFGDEKFLMVANMSRNVQCVEIDLGEFTGQSPLELFGQTRFPVIGDAPYFLTLGSHQFYWFLLHKPITKRSVRDELESMELVYFDDWKRVFDSYERKPVELATARFLEAAPWFVEKDQRIKEIEIKRLVPFRASTSEGVWLFIKVNFYHGPSAEYALPLMHVSAPPAACVGRDPSAYVFASLRNGDTSEQSYLVDGVAVPEFRGGILENLAKGRRMQDAKKGEISLVSTNQILKRASLQELSSGPSAFGSSSVTYDHKLFLRINRKIEQGSSPEAEIGAFLAKQQAECPLERLLGTIEYRDDHAKYTIGLLQEFVPNMRNMFEYSRDLLARYFEGALSEYSAEGAGREAEGANSDWILKRAANLMSSFNPAWARLGLRTMQLHKLVAAEREDPLFSPEPFSELYQRTLYQAIHVKIATSLELLREKLNVLPEVCRIDAKRLLEREESVQEELRHVFKKRYDGMRIRSHGDLQLQNVLFTGKDFAIVNFERLESRPWTELRIKRSCLSDVGAMLRSLQHVASLSAAADNIRQEDRAKLRPWKKAWIGMASEAFLSGYFSEQGDAPLCPVDQADRKFLLKFYVLQRAFDELEYDLKYRLECVWIGIEGILETIERDA